MRRIIFLYGKKDKRWDKTSMSFNSSEVLNLHDASKSFK